MRLDDGTRVHLADIRMIPDMPVFFGYIQSAGGVHPATGLTVTEDLGDHGFPTEARIDIAAGGPAQPGDRGDTRLLRPCAPAQRRRPHQPVPRAMVRCRTDDGRKGTGWIEWNQPEPAASAAGPPRARRTSAT